MNVGHLYVTLDAYTQGFRNNLNKATAKLEAFSLKAQAVGRKMTFMFTLPIVGAAAMGLKAFSDFNDEMTKSQAIMGNLSDEMKRSMEIEAKRIAGSSITSAKELAKSYYYLASAGLTAEQSVAALAAVERFAVAGMFDMARATDLATDAQSALGLTVKDAYENQQNLIHVTDVLVGANTLANASVEQFSEALTSNAGPAMKAYNISLEEGLSVLAAYADQGIKAGAAGNMISRMLRLLVKGAIANEEEWKKFGFTIWTAEGELKKMHEIIRGLSEGLDGMSTKQKASQLSMLGFIARSQQAILPLLGLQDRIEEYNDELYNMGGITREVSGKQLQSFISQLKITWNQIKLLTEEIGQRLAPMVLSLGEKIGAVTLWFKYLNESTKDSIVKWGLIIAAIGPVIWIMGKLIGLFLSLIGIFKAIAVFAIANPYIALAVAIGVAAVALQDFLTNNEAMVEQNKRLRKSIVSVQGVTEQWADAQGKLNRALEIGDQKAADVQNKNMLGVLKGYSEKLRGQKGNITDISTLYDVGLNDKDFKEAQEKVFVSYIEGIKSDLIRNLQKEPSIKLFGRVINSEGGFSVEKAMQPSVQEIYKAMENNPKFKLKDEHKTAAQVEYGDFFRDGKMPDKSVNERLMENFELTQFPKKQALNLLENEIAIREKNVRLVDDTNQSLKNQVAEQIKNNKVLTEAETSMQNMIEKLEIQKRFVGDTAGLRKYNQVDKFAKQAELQFGIDTDKYKDAIEGYTAELDAIEERKKQLGLTGEQQQMSQMNNALSLQVKLLGLSNKEKAKAIQLLKYQELAYIAYGKESEKAAKSIADYEESLNELYSKSEKDKVFKPDEFSGATKEINTAYQSIAGMINSGQGKTILEAQLSESKTQTGLLAKIEKKEGIS